MFTLEPNFPDVRRDTVVAEYRDPRDGFRLCIDVEHDGGLEGRAVLDAMRAAAAEWASTEAGRENPAVRDGTFNWGDLVEHVPSDVCRKHGFLVSGTRVAELAVEHDEHVLDAGHGGRNP